MSIINFAITKSHPLFDKQEEITEMIKSSGGSGVIPLYSISVIRGDYQHHRNIMKDKFKNLNYSIISFYSYHPIEEVRKGALEIRGKLIMEYIKHKREKNKENV